MLLNGFSLCNAMQACFSGAAAQYPETDAGLLNWWDASTGMTGTGATFELADSVGGKTLTPQPNDQDVIQTTFNSLPAMQLQNLDGIVGNDSMTFPASWMLMLAMDVQASSNAFAGSIGLTDGANGRSFYLRPRPATQHQMMHQQIASASGGFVQGPTGPNFDAFNTGGMHAFALVFDAVANSFTVFVDQVQLGSVSYTNDWANVNSGVLYIGGQNQGARPVDARIGEIILTSSVDSTTRGEYETYIADKWGISFE